MPISKNSLPNMHGAKFGLAPVFQTRSKQNHHSYVDCFEPTHRIKLKMHLRAAINNGVYVVTIKDLILHSALYCGLPAANEANHLTEDLFKELNPNSSLEIQ